MTIGWKPMPRQELSAHGLILLRTLPVQILLLNPRFSATGSM
jgi:hypothetical protein